MSETMVAEIILEQLGGRMFIRMVGAKNLLAAENTLQFRIGAGALNGINAVRVTLTPMDEYDVEFFRIRGTDSTKVAELNSIYADDLQSAFTANTGFKTTFLAVQK